MNKPRPTSPARPAGVLPAFQAVAVASGIEFQRYDDLRGLHRIFESTGGGVALLDYDHDGRLDVFFTNGCRLPRKTRTGAHSNEIFRQLARGRWARTTEQTGLAWNGYCQGCAVGDFNSDGFDDLYVAAFGQNRLWRNNGDGTFADVTASSGTDCSVWSSSVAFADFNRDGDLDLYVVNYLQAEDDPSQLCPHEDSPDGYVQCPPTLFDAENDVLFLADGSGGFVDATRQAGVTGSDGKGLGVVVLDVNRDGWPDIYVANDGMPNFLYMNQPEDTPHQPDDPGGSVRMPRFAERASQLGAAVNEQGAAEASMGIAHGDVDGDGWTDLLVTHFFAETNTFYRNLGVEGFAEQTRGSGLGLTSRLRLGFGTEFFDVDNNGWLDLFVANGHVDDMRWQPSKPPYAMPAQIFRSQQDGHFEDVSEWSGDYFRQAWLGRGVAIGDLDRDGDLDIVVSHQASNSELLRNDTATTNRSVILKLIGQGPSNRSAIGATVRGEAAGFQQVRQIAGGGSYQSASDTSVHFGLGDGEVLTNVTIQWPSGQADSWPEVPAGSYVVREGRHEIWPLRK